MIKALFGQTTTPYLLRQGLDDAMGAHRQVARRVADSMTSSAQTSREAAAGGAPSESDLVQDMASLADIQLRYETEARLLQLAYKNLRAAVRTNG
jgi:hypothetical protein